MSRLRICPLCDKDNLKHLRVHLERIHHLNSQQRKPLLRIAKYQKNYDKTAIIVPTQSQFSKPHVSVTQRTILAKPTVLPKIRKRKLVDYGEWIKKPYPDFQFKHPFSLMVVGPTSCGKTHFVRQLLEQKMKSFMFEWYYNQPQKTYDEFEANVGHRRVFFARGLPKYNPDTLANIDPKQKRVIIIDDLMEESKDSKLVSKLFTQGRHRNASVILILQNAFPKGKYNTEISRNAMYAALFKSPADREMISRVGQRTFANENSKFMNVYRRETEKPYGYVLIDNKPETEPNYQVVCDVFSSPSRYARSEEFSIPTKKTMHSEDCEELGYQPEDSYTDSEQWKQPKSELTLTNQQSYQHPSELDLLNQPNDLLKEIEWIVNDPFYTYKSVDSFKIDHQHTIPRHFKGYRLGGVTKDFASKKHKYHSKLYDNDVSCWLCKIVNNEGAEIPIMLTTYNVELWNFLKTNAHEVKQWTHL